MIVTLEQLQAVSENELKEFYYKVMLRDTINYVKANGGKAWVHPHVLADFGIKVS